METNFKGTTGEYYSYFNGQYHEVKRKEDHQDNRIQSISLMLYNDDIQSLVDSEECKANRDLIRDAFNVRQQINVDLPGLLKQRDELLEAVKEAKRVICSMKLSMLVHPDYQKDSEFYDMATTGEETEDKLEDLITKIEQK